MQRKLSRNLLDGLEALAARHLPSESGRARHGSDLSDYSTYLLMFRSTDLEVCPSIAMVNGTVFAGGLKSLGTVTVTSKPESVAEIFAGLRSFPAMFTVTRPVAIV